MPARTKNQEVNFKLSFGGRSKDFVWPVSTTPLPPLSLPAFFADLRAASGWKYTPNELTYRNSERKERMIRLGRPDEFYDFWKLVVSGATCEPRWILAYTRMDYEWNDKAVEELEVWIELMRRKGVTQQQMDGYHPGFWMATPSVPPTLRLAKIDIGIKWQLQHEGKICGWTLRSTSRSYDFLNFWQWTNTMGSALNLRYDPLGFTYVHPTEGRKSITDRESFEEVWSTLKNDVEIRHQIAASYQRGERGGEIVPYRPESPLILLDLIYHPNEMVNLKSCEHSEIKMYSLKSSLAEEEQRDQGAKIASLTEIVRLQAASKDSYSAATLVPSSAPRNLLNGGGRSLASRSNKTGDGKDVEAVATDPKSSYAPSFDRGSTSLVSTALQRPMNKKEDREEQD